MALKNDDLLLVNRGGTSFKTEYGIIKENILKDANVIVSDTAPTASNEGELWYNSKDDRLFIWTVTETTGVVTTLSIRNGGSGYTSIATDVETSGGTGFELTVDIEPGSGGSLANPKVNKGGHGYTVGDYIIVIGAGHKNGTLKVDAVNTVSVGKWVDASPGAPLTQDDLLFVDGRNASEAMQEFKAGVKVTGSSFFKLLDDDTLEAGQNWTGFQASKSGSPTITANNVKGFSASNLTNGTNVYGFHSDIINSPNRYNFYAAGSAPNYFAENVGIGPGVLANGINSPIHGSSTQSGVRLTPSSIEVSTNSTNPGASAINVNRIGASNGVLIRFSNAGAGVNSIALDGAGGINYGGMSDYRAKENIVDLPSAVDQIKALRPVNFNFISAPGKTRPGFIAHELAEILPVAVNGEKDATEAIGTFTDADGLVQTEVSEPEEIPFGATWEQTGIRNEYQNVDQSKLIPLLTKALQEALARIEQLEADHATLMNNGGY